MANYNIGTGKADITLRDVEGIGMLGFSIPEQKTDGRVLYTLYSRAFAIHDQQTDKHIMIVIADLWSCTEKVKKEVVSKIKGLCDGRYSAENVMISGTHTHSSPGGYSSYRMYNINTRPDTPKLKDKIEQNKTKIMDGIVASIEQAYENLKPGKIFIHTGNNNRIEDCGGNRSLEAYLKNPATERERYGHETDNYMTLIKFVHTGKKNKDIGILSWYPIHPTDYGQKNRMISGDNKGCAAHFFEIEMKRIGKSTTAQPFVAAFANSNCGDVSGAVVYNKKGKKIIRPPKGGAADIENMEKNGKAQFDKALELFRDEENLEELEGNIEFRYNGSVDMSDRKNIFGDPTKRTYIPTTGLAAYAGSKEDGTTPLLPFNLLNERKGLREDKLNVSERMLLLVIQSLTSGEGALGILAFITAQIISYLTLDSIPVSRLTDEELEGHFPKPIAVVAKDIVPSVLPMQLFKIGNLAIPGIPGELTTMAGRRLRETILKAFSPASQVKYVALGTYSNAYAQYITTKEEYDNQNYEGASNLFGPHTLEAYQEIFEGLAKDMEKT